jgi:photosystem II stability/assembly factor-like uncharacterized protein
MRRDCRRAVGALCVVLAAAGPAFSQKAAPSALEAQFARALRFRFVGPWEGGRVVAVAGVPEEPRTFYMGSTGGGVWKTTDAGTRWTNVSDGFFGSASVSSLAVASSDANVVYAATGETCLRNNISAGDGVYRSDDAGRSWRHAGLGDSGQIGKVRVHPKDPDLVYAAVLGHAFGPNPERGVFRSRDGGRRWQRVLFVSDKAGAVDLAMDETNPRVLYAAFWEVVRKPWSLSSGGPGSGLYKTTDGGDTWTPLSKGLPAGIKGKIGVAVSPAEPQRVWALVEALPGEAGLYRSDDAGANFRLVGRDKRPLARAFYYTHLAAHPKDPDVLFSPSHSRGLLRSTDGGRSFEAMDVPGGDFHALWVNPKDPTAWIVGYDGGAVVSLDAGKSWSRRDNQPTAEMYGLTLDEGFPYRLYGAQQDGPTVSVPSRTVGAGIGRSDVYNVGGGEHGDVAVDPRDPRIVYSGNYEGILERYDHPTGQTRNISAYPQLGEGVAAKDYRYRFPILAPVRVSPHDPSVLYHVSQLVHRSRNEGQTWTVISPDLTRNDPSKQGPTGGPITRDHTGPEVYDTISAFEESALEKGVLWAGSDDGLVHVSRDGGDSWTNVTPKALPEWGTVNRIDISRHAPGRVFLAVHRYRLDDFQPYIFRTDDYGKTWKRLTDGAPGISPRHFVRVVREDPVRKGLLYAGTEYGLYLSFDDGKSWPRFQLNLPITPVTDLKVKDDDLAVSTQGRGFFVLDDLTSLRQLAGATPSRTSLLKPRATLRMEGSDGERAGLGQNPPNGALVHYLLPADLRAEEELRLEFHDAGGRLVRAFSSKAEDEASRPGTTAGLHRFKWDLRHEAPRLPKGATHAGPYLGPRAVPGVYEVRLSVGPQVLTERFDVRKDPRLATTADEFQEQLDLALAIRDRVSSLFEAQSRSRVARAQVARLFEGPSAGVLPATLTAQAKGLHETLLAAETEIVDPRLDNAGEVIHYGPSLDFELADLLAVVESADARPTDGARERFRDLDERLRKAVGRVDEILDKDLDALEARAHDAGVRLLGGPAPAR